MEAVVGRLDVHSLMERGQGERGERLLFKIHASNLNPLKSLIESYQLYLSSNYRLKYLQHRVCLIPRLLSRETRNYRFFGGSPINVHSLYLQPENETSSRIYAMLIR